MVEIGSPFCVPICVTKVNGKWVDAGPRFSFMNENVAYMVVGYTSLPIGRQDVVLSDGEKFVRVDPKWLKKVRLTE